MTYFDEFGKKWASEGSIQPISDTQRQVGWDFLGSVPPISGQFNQVQQNTDEKINYLFNLINSFVLYQGGTLNINSTNEFRDVLNRALSIIGSGHVGYSTYSELLADTSQPVRTIGEVFGDPVEENNGFYLWDGTQWIKQNNPLAAALAESKSYTDSFSSLTKNSTVNFPFIPRTRNGIEPQVLSLATEAWTKKAILKVVVDNARPGCYYRIAASYPPNNALYACRWIIEECAIDGFDVTDTAVRIITNEHVQPMYQANTGLQTIVVKRTSPEYRDIRFYITLQTNGLTSGNFFAVDPTDNAYAWIIDPSCYVLNYDIEVTNTAASAAQEALTTAGAAQLSASAAQTTADAAVDLANSAQIQANIGTTIAQSAQTTWSVPNRIFNETDIAKAVCDLNGSVLSYYEKSTGKFRGSLQTSDAYQVYPIRTFDEPSAGLLQMDSVGNITWGYDENGRLRAPTVSSDAYVSYPYREYLDAFTFARVDATGNVFEAFPRADDDSLPAAFGGIYVDSDPINNRFFMTWQHGVSQMLRVCYQNNGFNDLFNWRSTYIAPLGNPANAEWTQLQESSSDCWPPMIVEAVENGDGAPYGGIYTGGNHGSSGGAGGLRTARMSSFKAWVDDKQLMPGEAYKGYANKLTFEWVNEVMGNNTITLDRYILAQKIKAFVRPGDISAFVKVTAYEQIRVNADNGCQMFWAPYDTVHYYDGQQQARTAITVADAGSSGPDMTYKAWACVFRSDIYGCHGSWIDHGFEAGDGRYINGSAGYYRYGGADKFYGAVRGGGGSSISPVFNAGEGYQWHAGYFWSPADAITGTVDSVFTFHKRGLPHVGFAFTAAGNGNIVLPESVSGREITGIGVAGAEGVAVSATAYQTTSSKLEN